MFFALMLTAAFASPPIAQEEDPLAAEIDRVVARELAAGNVPGAAVSVVSDGELVFARGYGVADLETQEPVVAERTLFRVGSVTKVFTTLGLTQRIDEGELGYDDALGPLLGELAIANPYDEEVRVRHLLTHTGGFDQIGTSRQVADPASRPALDAFLANQLRVVFPPGTVSCYDTYGTTLGGYVLERLSGTTYAQYVAAKICEPLGMERTFVEAPEPFRSDLARGYGWDGARHLPQEYEWYITLPASSIDSTVVDMAALMIALLGDGTSPTGEGRLLSAAALERVRAPQYRDHPQIPGFTHGLWELERYGPDHPALQHGGTMRGYSTDMTLFTRDRVGVFVACNRDGETGPFVGLHRAVIDSVFEVLFGAIPRSGPTEPALEPDLAPLLGTYANTLFCRTCPPGEGWPVRPFQVGSPAPGVLEFHGSRWLAIEPLVFQTQGGRARAAFRLNAEGRVTHFFTANSSFERLD